MHTLGLAAVAVAVVVAALLQTKAFTPGLPPWPAAHPEATGPMAPAALREVIKATTRYADGIACEVMDISPGNVVLLAHSPFDKGGKGSRYAVLWTADIGCHGGSGTTFTHIAIVHSNGRGDGLHVDPLQSSPAVDFDSPVRMVERVVHHTHDTLVLEGLMAGGSDASCCPTVPVRFTLRVNEAGHWRLASMRRMA